MSLTVARRYRLTATLLCSVCAACSAQVPSVKVDEAATKLSFPDSHVRLMLAIVNNGAPLPGQAAAQLLDTENEVRSSGESACQLQTGETFCNIEMPPATPGSMHPGNDGDQLPHFRVRYTVRTAGGSLASGILALDHIAPELFELHVAVPKDIRRGAEYTARVKAIHPLTRAPSVGVPLSVQLSASHSDNSNDDVVFAREHVVTDAGGFASIPFTVPADEDISSVDLDVNGVLANLRLTTTQTLTIPEIGRLDLTTDKPLYQPGQTVHTRLLLLDRNGRAATQKTVRVDVLDPNDTLVFRGEAETSSFGIAAIDWPVPARMRLGEYTIRGEVKGDDDPSLNAYATLRLSRYDLPTFVVAPHPDRPFYLPGSNAIVDIRANYLFGKPVLHGHVRVVREDEREWNFARQSYDTKEGKAVTGELDAQGSFHAHIPLAAGLQRYKSEGASNAFEDLHYAAYVTDASTKRTEQRRFDIRIAAQAIQLYVQTGSQPRGLPQRYYLAATTADGAPVECDLDLFLLPPASPTGARHTLAGRRAGAHLLQYVHTDSHGLARLDLPSYEELLKLMPADRETNTNAGNSDSVADPDEPEFYIAARSRDGRTGAIVQQAYPSTQAVRITTSKELYRPGDRVDIGIDSAESSLPLTVQILRHTRRGDITLATREVTLAHGHASLSIPSDERFSGFVYIDVVGIASAPAAYSDYTRFVGGDDRTSFDSHVVLFPRDNSLHVDVAMSAEKYRPGEQATASLTVRGPQDSDGDDTSQAPNAVGIVVVDQAVEERNRTDGDFSGSNPQPFFFRWNTEYDSSMLAGGFSLQDLQRLDLSKPVPPQAQLAAEVLLARFTGQFDRTDNRAGDDLSAVFNKVLDRELQPVRAALKQILETRAELPTNDTELAAILNDKQIDFLALRDPWGDPYRVISKAESRGVVNLTLLSNGPDKQRDTADDFAIPLATWQWFAGHKRQLENAVVAFHKRTGKYIRSVNDLRNEMHTEGVDLDAWRDPWGQPFSYQFSVAQKNFVLEALSAGDPKDKPRYPSRKDAFNEGIVSIDYTTELQSHIEAAIANYTAAHSFPVNKAEFHAALQSQGITQTQLRDPWGRPLYARFLTHSFYTDRVHTEAYATPASTPQNRTTITPVTAVSDIVELHSPGADGKLNTADDFVVAAFSRTRSMQSAQESVAKRVNHLSVHTGETGDIGGTVTDPSGAVIPGAIVIATHMKTGNAYEAKTDSDGRYILGPIPAGTYKLRLSARGFMDMVYGQVEVLSRNIITLDAKLNVGSVSETVEVSAAPAMLSTESASISTAQVSNLPGMVRIAPGAAGTAITSTPRLRDYFPETLLWRPEMITAPDGTATLHFPVADSITTWQLSASGSTLQGNVGSGATQFRTFQPFFAAFDPPATLTVGDTIALPVTLRNYLDHSVKVSSTMTPATWFRLKSEAAIITAIPAQDAASPVFRFTALAPVINAPQEFTAKADGAGDRIARPVSVHPDGMEAWATAASILSTGENTLTFSLPQASLADSSDVSLRVYPNLGAHLRDALTAMATYPNGCAEQLISTAWPSLLLLKYAASLPAKDEKSERKFRLNLQEAYENLLANQLADGGFAYWTRDADSDLALTAYAVEFLSAARTFITIDDRVVTRAIDFLAKQQKPASQPNAGLWVRVDRDHKPHAEDIHANAMLTASIAAMLSSASGAESILRKALAALDAYTREYDEPYTLASYALAALALKDSERSGLAIPRLRALSHSENGGAYWGIETNTPFFGWGRAGRVEATAQVLRALVASGARPQDDLIARGLLFLNHEQDRHSLWYSTQATARVLDVLADIAMRASASPRLAKPDGLLVRVDHQPAINVPLPPGTEDADPVFVPLGTTWSVGTHQVMLDLPSGSQAATAQLVANFYQPWATPQAPAATATERLLLSVAFSTTRPLPGKQVDVSAHIERVGFHGYGMMIAEIGLPPGTEVDRASLESAVTASGFQINHYEVLPDKVLIYLWPNAGGLSLHFRFALRYAIDALTAPSSVYDYYNPDARFDLAPARITTR